MSRRRIDLAGKRFGKLTVISPTDDLYSARTKWNCSCDCGNVSVVSAHNLIYERKVMSCGCTRNSLPHLYQGGLSSLNQIYHAYKGGAKKRQLQFDLSREQCFELFQQPCHYCGLAPSNSIKDVLYSGIDRVDSTKGYTTDNCVPCCKFCNHAKSNNDQEFFDWLNRVIRKVKENV